MTSTKELLSQVFVLAFRRALAREPGTQAVANHVTQACARLGIEPDERTLQKGLRLVGAALGRVDDTFPRDARLARALLIDLIHSRDMDEAEVAALVAAGERRLAKTRRKWWPLKGPTPLAPPRTSPRGPRTITGHTLRALALQDNQPLPEDPSPQCAEAIIDNAFAIAVRERFGERPDPDHIVLLAKSLSRHSRTIAASDVESLVLAEYAEAAEPPETAAEIKVAAFVRIAEDLALYDHEIDDLITMAESIAEEDGCQLSLMGD